MGGPALVALTGIDPLPLAVSYELPPSGLVMSTVVKMVGGMVDEVTVSVVDFCSPLQGSVAVESQKVESRWRRS